jgi:hypothetical protein
MYELREYRGKFKSIMYSDLEMPNPIFEMNEICGVWRGFRCTSPPSLRNKMCVFIPRDTVKYISIVKFNFYCYSQVENEKS